jgi:Na+-transporting methylmalonyl-CoA/oxaloacetate decarboxylase beta subunit
MLPVTVLPETCYLIDSRLGHEDSPQLLMQIMGANTAEQSGSVMAGGVVLALLT